MPCRCMLSAVVNDIGEFNVQVWTFSIVFRPNISSYIAISLLPYFFQADGSAVLIQVVDSSIEPSESFIGYG